MCTPSLECRCGPRGGARSMRGPSIVTPTVPDTECSPSPPGPTTLSVHRRRVAAALRAGPRPHRRDGRARRRPGRCTSSAPPPARTHLGRVGALRLTDAVQVTIAEIKARCPDPEAALDRMRELGATHHGRDHQVDTYFVVARGRLKLRQGDLETNLVHYRRADLAGPKESEVLLHTPSDGTSLHAALSAALEILVVVDKQREILWSGNVKLHVDHLAGLGAFVEVEAIDRDGARTRAELHQQGRRWLEAGVPVVLAENRADIPNSQLSRGDPTRGSGSCLERSEVGVGLFDGVGVGLPLVVLAERPVDAGQARGVAFAIAVGMTRSGRIDSTDSPPARRRKTCAACRR